MKISRDFSVSEMGKKCEGLETREEPRNLKQAVTLIHRWFFQIFNNSCYHRAPGSLSDRWSSLATIYPLRFHEIFGRWLSYNIKRQNQTSVSVFQQNNLINALISRIFEILNLINLCQPLICTDSILIYIKSKHSI